MGVCIIILPFLLEILIKNILCRFSGFTSEVWFSFLGSYVGAIITLLVMLITFTKARKDSKREREWLQCKTEIEREIASLDALAHTLLLDNYYFGEIIAQNIFPQFRKFLQEFRNNETILDLVQAKGNLYNEKKNLIQALGKLQVEEAELINNSTLFSGKLEGTLEEDQMRVVSDLIDISEKHRTTIRDLYKKYVDKAYNNLFDNKN